MARSAIRFEAQDFHVPPPPLDARGFGEWGHGFLSRLIEWSRDPVIQSITFVPQTSYERMDFTWTADAARRDTVLYLSEDLAASARPACYDGWRGGGLYRYVGGNVWSYLLAESGITQVPGTSACTAWSWYSSPSLASAIPSPEPIVSQITSANFRAMRDRAFADAQELRRRAINPVVDWVRFERRVLSELDDNLDNPTATGLHAVALLETAGSATAPAAWANEGLYAYSTEATFGGLEGDNPWHPVERRISTDPSSQTAQWYPALAERWVEIPVIPPPPADTRWLGDWWRSSFNLASEYLRRPTVRRLRFREDLLTPYSTASTGYSTATLDVRGKTVWVQNSAVWCAKKGPVTYTGLGDWSAWLESAVVAQIGAKVTGFIEQTSTTAGTTTLFNMVLHMTQSQVDQHDIWGSPSDYSAIINGLTAAPCTQTATQVSWIIGTHAGTSGGKDKYSPYASLSFYKSSATGKFYSCSSVAGMIEYLLINKGGFQQLCPDSASANPGYSDDPLRFKLVRSSGPSVLIDIGVSKTSSADGAPTPNDWCQIPSSNSGGDWTVTVYAGDITAATAATWVTLA